MRGNTAVISCTALASSSKSGKDKTKHNKHKTYTGTDVQMLLFQKRSGSYSALSSTCISPSSEGLAPGPYQRPKYLSIMILTETIELRSGICSDIEFHSGIYSDISCVQDLVDERVRDCGVGSRRILGT